MSEPHGEPVLRPFRRTRIGAAVLLLAVAATWVVTRQASGVVVADPGQGTASGQILRVDPRAGSLSIGVALGEALAGHQNQAAKAQSLSLDLGVIGTSLTTSDCNMPPALSPSQIPQPLILENSQPGADKGVTQSQEGGALTQYGKATTDPYAEAVTTVAAQTLGPITIGTGVAKSWSGIVGGHRQAGGTVDIAGISLMGLLSINGLHWSVLDQTTGPLIHTGSFSMGSVTLAGKTISLGDAASSLTQLNALLSPLGMLISAPTVHETQGTEYVDPLQIAVVPSQNRDNLLNQLLLAIQPVRQPVFGELLKLICKTDTPLELTDITIGSISGAGSFDVQLGGLQATTGEIKANRFDLSLPGLSIPTVTVPAITLGNNSTGGQSTDVTTSNGVSYPTPPTTAAPAAVQAAPQAIEPITKVHGKRGGALAAVALGGLLILAVLAEGDRRMMRRAQRRVTFED